MIWLSLIIILYDNTVLHYKCFQLHTSQGCGILKGSYWKILIENIIWCICPYIFRGIGFIDPDIRYKVKASRQL